MNRISSSVTRERYKFARAIERNNGYLYAVRHLPIDVAGVLRQLHKQSADPLQVRAVFCAGDARILLIVMRRAWLYGEQLT